MQRVMGSLTLWVLANTAICAADGVALRSSSYSANVLAGSVVELTASDGTTYVTAPAEQRGLSIHRGDTTVWATSREATTALAPGESQARTYEEFSTSKAARAEVRYEVEAATGDLLIQQRATATDPGLWGVGWWIADIPLDYAILVPGGSGLRLTRTTPGPNFQYDYPISWEVQCVIVEGPRGGFYVWAEDPRGRFKRLVVERRPTGWRLGLITINDAPFDKLTECESVTWRLNTYSGDWRVPARRYRDWFQKTCQPVPVAEQQPTWVKDIRGCVIMGLDNKLLEALPTRFDPTQTLLYLYDWRTPGYDRNYPDYAHMHAALQPFLTRAHELGFRTMLHVNYFGVDPLHSAYKQFEPYQVRSPWGAHDKEWWVWPPEAPDIRFAYINPACQAWRDYFTAAMTQLCQTTGVDALHLDQTLCIYNDDNGRIEGMSMLEGNLALHRQLRQALPHVALSGEGLNEVTCRYEAFAQRHVAGLDHSKGTYDRQYLDAAHPISSYLLRPYTIMYGYLGCAPPEDDQLYAAWNEAYRHWGVIPTLKPTRANLAATSGFAEQFFDELRCWQEQRVDIDMDGPWPAEVTFPLKTAQGEPFVATQDRRWVCGEQVISQTITGATQWTGTATIPGWLAYDANRLLGLHADRWYPVLSRPRAADRFHVCEMPENAMIDYVAVSPKLALVALRDAQPVLADLTVLLEQALCGSRPAQGPAQQRSGPGEFPDGATFTNSAGVIAAHPPWKIAGSGQAFARFTCKLPANRVTWFTSDVYIDPAAVGPGKSDGVTFRVRVSGGNHEIQRELHYASAQPLPVELELTQFQGQTVELELAVEPGPQNSPTYDWARWRRPRVEQRLSETEPITVDTTDSWRVVLNEHGSVPVAQSGTRISATASLPGAVAFLREPPPAITPPLDLSKTPDQVFFVLDSGTVVDAALYAGVTVGANVVSGVRREGLFVHPPNNGRTIAIYLLTLPAVNTRFLTQIGLRDGSKSEGVEVTVEVNGSPCARRMIQPGTWDTLEVDLSRWAGAPIVLSLVTDSAGAFNHDWTVWGEPRIVAP